MRFAFPFLMAVMLVAGCGYSLELSKLEEQKEEEDPITLIRRDIRQIKADHRVALFDLRKEQNEQIKQLQADLGKIGALRQDISQLNRRFEERQATLSRRNADIDERISEMEIHHRLIQGSIEEEANRMKEVSEQASNFALKELEELKKDFSSQDEQRKKLEKTAEERIVSVQKNVKDQLAAVRQEEKSGRQSLQTQIDSAKAITGGLEKSLNDQSQAIKELSDQLSQIIEKVLPAVNALGERVDTLELQSKKLDSDIDSAKTITGGLEKSLDDESKVIKDLSDQLSQVIEKVLPAVNGLGERVDTLEWQLKKLDSDIDVDALNRRMSDLTDAVDVQRQSLEMLGNTITSQVDEQRGLLRQAIDRLKDIESAPSSKRQ